MDGGLCSSEASQRRYKEDGGGEYFHLERYLTARREGGVRMEGRVKVE